MQKELGHFQRALPRLATTDPIAAPGTTVVKGDAVKAYQRISGTGDKGPRFLGYRLADSNSTTDTTFTTSLDLDSRTRAEQGVLHNDSDEGFLTFSGTDWQHTNGEAWAAGDHRLLYTTSQPFGSPVVSATRGTVEYLVGHAGDPGEAVLQFPAGSSSRPSPVLR